MPHSGEGYGRIVDILEAIDKIARFTNGLDETSFSSNPLVRDAVVWNLTAILISHRLADVFAVTDRIMVPRQGRIETKLATVETDTTEVVTYIVGTT